MNTINPFSLEQNLSFEEKIFHLKKIFETLESPSEKYELIIDLGKNSHLDAIYKTDANLVFGCQSQLYLVSENKEGLIFFSSFSDSLITSGLAALLIFIYNGETPETIIKNPPQFLQSLGIYASLSPNRSMGMAHIYLKMKMVALKNL